MKGKFKIGDKVRVRRDNEMGRRSRGVITGGFTRGDVAVIRQAQPVETIRLDESVLEKMQYLLEGDHVYAYYDEDLESLENGLTKLLKVLNGG